MTAIIETPFRKGDFVRHVDKNGKLSVVYIEKVEAVFDNRLGDRQRWAIDSPELKNIKPKIFEGNVPKDINYEMLTTKETYYQSSQEQLEYIGIEYHFLRENGDRHSCFDNQNYLFSLTPFVKEKARGIDTEMKKLNSIHSTSMIVKLLAYLTVLESKELEEVKVIAQENFTSLFNWTANELEGYREMTKKLIPINISKNDTTLHISFPKAAGKEVLIIKDSYSNEGVIQLTVFTKHSEFGKYIKETFDLRNDLEDEIKTKIYEIIETVIDNAFKSGSIN
ncbi:hypothetical protein CN918_29030 [Priestia megaterium]|nr:hypothetical protein CN918_29030 [Priestia megaterium]